MTEPVEEMETSKDMDGFNKDKKRPKKKAGIIYLSRVPQFMNVSTITSYMSDFGKVGRIYLRPGVTNSGKKAPHFVEGWIEFQSKRVAKEVAMTLNNKQISPDKKSKFYDQIWNLKYLPRFKWIHLSERMDFEKAVYKSRMRADIAQERRAAAYFAENLGASEALQRKKKKLENPTIHSLIKYKQRKTNDEILQLSGSDKAKGKQDRTEFIKDIFGTSTGIESGEKSAGHVNNNNNDDV